MSGGVLPAFAEDRIAARGARVELSGIRRRYGTVEAVAGVSLEVEAGEFVSLLGPSGSGKTTLLMILAGFDRPQEGSVRIGGADMTTVPPNRRDVAMVFQRYALFPHMTVAENIAFPLKMRSIGRAEREARVRAALGMVKLDGYAERRPAELSGGQQQRVALARAIVFEPPLILMDEPLGALDRKLRQHMQIELKQLQRRLGATVIYVTHDQEEALTMSDRVAVMDHGRLMQYGPPRDLYERPANPFVADFIGEMNFLPGTLRRAEAGGSLVQLPTGEAVACGAAALPEGSAVRIAVRPEHVAVLAADAAEGLAGRIAQVVFNGAQVALLVSLADGAVLRSDVRAGEAAAHLPPGTPVRLGWPPEAAHVFAAGGA